MPLKTKPFGNMALVEITREYEGVSRATDDSESQSVGILRDFSLGQYHVTASAAIQFDQEFLASSMATLEGLIGKTVRWEQFAEAGQTFQEDGKTYALIPWWRIIGVEA